VPVVSYVLATGLKEHFMSESETKAEEVKNEEDSKPTDPLAILFPPDPPVLAEARRLAGDKNVRVESLATACLQDPVIIIELLKISNALYFSGGRSAITSPKTAIVRLGSDVVIETLDTLLERQSITEEVVREYFENFRSRSKRIGIVSRLLSEALARTLSEDTQAAGCLFSVGDMLAVHHFSNTYVKLASQHQRSGVNYRLSQNQRFDVERMGAQYLRRNGIPEALVFAVERDGRPKTPDRGIMKPICFAASELVDAFDNNKWERFAPGKTFSPKSALRTLQMTDSQYLKVYERASEYLFSAKMIEERRRAHGYDMPLDFDPTVIGELEDSEQESITIQTEENASLDAEIQSLLAGGFDEDPSDHIENTDEELEQTGVSIEHDTTAIKEVPEQLGAGGVEQFALNKAGGKKSTPRASKPVTVVAPPKLRSKKSSAFVDGIASLMDDASSSEELLANLLQRLTDGPFEKAALIVVSQDRKYAIVVAARGPTIGNGQRIDLNDPLSPLAQCFSKVQSFATRVNEASPFGSKSFALAPIDADHETPVALYADCGNSGALTFDARRVFRTVVEILNAKLPCVPGGIPVELEDTQNTPAS